MRLSINKTLYISFMLLLSMNSNCQVTNSKLNQEEQGYLKTLINLARYLRSEKTPVISFHETEGYSEEERFYDKVIDIFFAKDRMVTESEKNTNFFAPGGIYGFSQTHTQ